MAVKNKPFRFIHTADTHLGYSGNASRYNEYSALRINKEVDNMNVREKDILDAFKETIDIAIREKVDAVVHAGDLFDFWGYKKPIVYNYVQKEILRLTQHDILFIVIIGNHDLPKIAGKGTYLESLSNLENVHAVYRGFYEKICLEDFGVMFHCLPSTFTQDILDEGLDQVEPVPGYINIGVGHFGVTSIKHYAQNAANTLVVDLDRLIQCKMDYFALGDFHKTVDFGHNIWYSGPAERMGFGEIEHKPGVLLVEMDPESKDVRVESIKVGAREMMDIPELDAKNKTPEEINDEIKARFQSLDVAEKIIRFRIRNLPTNLKAVVDVAFLEKATEECLYFKLELVDKMEQTKGLKTSVAQFEGVLEGWDPFVDYIAIDESFDREKIRKMGYDKLMEVYEDAAHEN